MIPILDLQQRPCWASLPNSPGNCGHTHPSARTIECVASRALPGPISSPAPSLTPAEPVRTNRLAGRDRLSLLLLAPWGIKGTSYSRAPTPVLPAAPQRPSGVGAGRSAGLGARRCKCQGPAQQTPESRRSGQATVAAAKLILVPASSPAPVQRDGSKLMAASALNGLHLACSCVI